jgi:5'-nucleotidase
MQKDFKIGLAIGAVLVAGTVIWLATLPNLSARARAIQAASNASPSSQTPADISRPVISPQSTDDLPPTTSDESQVTSDETRNTSDEVQTANKEQRTTNSGLTQRIHVVQRGDTLSSISAKYYGSSKQWRKIVAANRDNLPDPNRLTPGSKLIIPD